MTPLFALLFDSLDARLRLRRPSRQALNKVFPHHWSFLLGEMALFSFVILILTGIFLAMFYDPSVEPVTYTGSNVLYQGREVPGAFESILHLSHDVPGGLLFRRVHRGAAYVFMAAVVLHLLRILLTGAFRRPREVNYHIGIALLALSFGLAATGQALPYDVVEGAAVRVIQTFLLALPFIGEDVAFWIFGGEFFGDAIPRLYVAHILILPGLVGGLIAMHLMILVRQRHTQFRRRGVDSSRWVYGKPMWPSQFVTSTVLFIGLAGVIVLMSVLAPWSDFSTHGPAASGVTSSTNHPDWWLAWAEGVLVVWPAWEWYPIPGVIISASFVAGVLFPGALFTGLAAYPFIDRRLPGAKPTPGQDVHELQRPFEVPARAAIVTSGFSFVVTMAFAGNADYLSWYAGLPVQYVVGFFQAGIFVIPAVVFGLVLWRARIMRSKREAAAGGDELARSLEAGARPSVERSEP